MLDFYQWFPMSEGGEWAVRFAAFGGLVSMAWSARRERREYEERVKLIEYQQSDLFAVATRNIATEAMVLSFRANDITLYGDFVAWHNSYMRCARRTANFFVFSG